MRSSPAAGTLRRRIVLACLAVVTLGSGLLVHRIVGGPIGDVVGDALYAVLIYLLAAFALPRAPAARPALIALAFCSAIELFQLTGLPQTWASAFPPSALVFGSGFDVRDIIVYALAISAVAVADALLAKTPHRTPAGHATGRPPEGERPV